jgi:hypothetical protein
MVAGKHALVAGFAAAGLAAVLAINAEAGSQEARKPSPVVGRNAWPGVHIPDPVALQAGRQALDEARELLAKPRCMSVLDEYADREGRTLSDRLEILGVDVETYITMVEFIDDTRDRSCVEGVLGFARPGRPVVHLCIDEFKRMWQRDPRYVVAALIHELLHTLGLGENPPSTQDITRRVVQLCHEE